jgi:hypothetical protein
MKKSVTMKIITVLCLFLVLSGSFIFQSCQKEEYLASEEEIFKSNEFIDYINAGIIYYGSMIEKVLELSKHSQRNPNNRTVILNSALYELTIIGRRNFNVKINKSEMQNRYNALLKKYPNYSNFKPEKLKQHILETFIIPKISLTISTFTFFNQKSATLICKGSLEDPDPDQYYYEDFEYAFAVAMSYSNCTQKECAGFVFLDGSAMIYFYDAATHSSTLYIPGSLECDIELVNDHSYYNGKLITSTFHTHFYTNDPGGDDGWIQTRFFPNSDLIIIRQDQWWCWKYINGMIQAQSN